MIATIRPRLVMHRRVNLRVANWSSKARHFALYSDAVIVISVALGHFNLTGLLYMTRYGSMAERVQGCR